MLTKPVQSLGFALVQARERARPGGVVIHDADPRPRYVTSVIRVGDELSGVLTEVARALPGVAGHYVYPSSDLHLTVLNLDTARQRTVADRVDAAQDVLAGVSSFPVVLAGLGISRRSIYARAYDPTGSLWRARAQLTEATGCRPPWPLRLLGFVNILRFTQPYVGDPLAGPADLRRMALGTFEATAVEIVHTDKVLSTAGTIVLRRVALSR